MSENFYTARRQPSWNIIFTFLDCKFKKKNSYMCKRKTANAMKQTLIRPYKVAVLSSSNGKKPFNKAYNNTPRLQTSAFGPI